MQKKINTEFDIIDLIKKRWSPRAFDSRPIEMEKLHKIFEAGRWASSCFNEQPWRFILGRKNKGYEYQKIFNSINENNQRWAKKAPVLVAICAKKTFTQTSKENAWNKYDTGQAVSFMVLQAISDDIYAHQMAGIDRDKLKEDFSIPDDFEVICIMAMGYYGDPETLPEDLRKKEEAEQIRQPLDKMIFMDDWISPKSSIFGED